MFATLLNELAKEPAWTAIGLAGQLTFGGRFLLQWIVSEYKNRSHVPTAFWFLSLFGSILLLRILFNCRFFCYKTIVSCIFRVFC